MAYNDPIGYEAIVVLHVDNAPMDVTVATLAFMEDQVQRHLGQLIVHKTSYASEFRLCTRVEVPEDE
jgi:hypothetical protein